MYKITNIGKNFGQGENIYDKKPCLDKGRNLQTF